MKISSRIALLLFKNFCSASNINNARVRFAPSPTGYLHLGGLRTALFNYLFAKSLGGKFVLRIEDTDQKRLVPGAAEQLEDDLNWVGIHPDESPKLGGPYGPYLQSQRVHLYREHVKHLLTDGTAYYCFCSDKRLDLLRREALRARQVPRYDNRCRNLSTSEVNKRLDRGDAHCIRFKLTSEVKEFNDLVYGQISFDVAKNEGDPVIMKADGFPTYHFANVVDDHLMEISHVLRGVEWQVSTPKHIMLFRAFGWEPPFYAHLPLILNSDGSKLSKRQSDIKVESYRNDGIFPEALLNFVTDAGGGFAKDLERDKPLRIYSLDELVKQFDLKRVKPSSCRLTPERLPELNSLEFQRKLNDEEECKVLVQRVKEMILNTFGDRLEHQSLQLQEEHILSVLKWGKARIHKLTDLLKNDLAFIWITPSSFEEVRQIMDIRSMENLYSSLNQLTDAEFKKETLKPFLNNFSKERNIQFYVLMKALRYILSGLKEGPGVAEMMEILGKTSTITRISNAVQTLKTAS